MLGLQPTHNSKIKNFSKFSFLKGAIFLIIFSNIVHFQDSVTNKNVDGYGKCAYEVLSLPGLYYWSLHEGTQHSAHCSADLP